MKIIKYSAYIIVVVLAMILYSYSHIVRLVLIDYSDFNKSSNNLYISASINESAYDEIEKLINEARLRIADYYGSPIAEPTIIIVNESAESDHFLLYSHPGKLYSAPWATYLILDYRNIGVDVTAHELVHAEIVHRVGYWARYTKIPTWFDEGAALQVDWRENYLELAPIEQAELNRVKTLDSPKKFWTSDSEQNIKNYQSAKMAFQQIYMNDSDFDLYDFLGNL